jgi:electron transport complex protein RnfD
MVILINNISHEERNDLQRFARATSFLLALNVMAFYYYGFRATLVTIISVGISLLTEYICCQIVKKKFRLVDTSPIMSGMILALLMPASVPYRVVIFAAVFMIAVCKYAFGGNNNLIFSPAAVAYAFCALTWPNSVLRYPSPAPFGRLPLSSDIPDVMVRSFTHNVDVSLSSSSYLDIIWGKLAGPMGTSCVLIILICAVSLYFFRDIPPSAFFSAVASNTLLFVLFPISASGWTAAMYSVVTGSFMFVLVFMACDLRFVPKRGFAQALYGIAFSTVSFVLRKYCGFENSAVFGFLIASVFSSELDRFDLFAGNKLSKLGAILDQKISKAFIYIKFRTYTEDTAPKKQKESHKERRESLNKPEKRGESLNKPKVSQKKSLKELTELRRKSVRESQKEIGETRKGSTEDSSEQTQEKLDVSRKESQKESQVEPHSDSNKESHKNKKSEEQK